MWNIFLKTKNIWNLNSTWYLNSKNLGNRRDLIFNVLSSNTRSKKARFAEHNECSVSQSRWSPQTSIRLTKKLKTPCATLDLNDKYWVQQSNDSIKSNIFCKQNKLQAIKFFSLIIHSYWFIDTSALWPMALPQYVKLKKFQFKSWTKKT